MGFETQKQLEDYLHRIGNLTLLYNTDNSAIGNWDFADKTDVYKKSDFKITHTIVEALETPIKNEMDTKLYNKINKYEPQYHSLNGQWTKELIEKRSEDLSDLMYKILIKNIE